jgi:hypothetical protein
MSLAYPHGYVVIHIGVCAALQVVISARGLGMYTRPRETRAASTIRTQTANMLLKLLS